MGKTTPQTARQAIRVWLAQHDKTQTWLAHEAGCDEGLFSKILAGYKSPSNDVADAVARITKIDLREFSKAS